ncbi:hypothetical protein BC831DRAFT_402187 [Entophlyctis helioformis]|nr:hypothetical protein BC831DRAFT_402187 [Entophlyctis helioformis]
MSPTIEEAVPDIAVGAVSVAVLVAYHVWLYIKVQQHPEQTVFGISSAARRIWIASIMYRKEEILAVQTLRNYIMATSLLATTSVGLIFGLTAFLSNIGKSGDGGSSSSSSGLFAFTSNNLFGIKIILFILAQVGAFFSLSQSLRFYNHVCITVNTNITQEELARLRPSAVIAYTHLDANRVGDMLNRAAFFYTLAMRMYYVSVPLLGWFAGPAGLGVTTGLLVCVLRVIDVNWDSDGYVALDGSGPGDVEAGAGAGAVLAAVGRAVTVRALPAALRAVSWGDRSSSPRTSSLSNASRAALPARLASARLQVRVQVRAGPEEGRTRSRWCRSTAKPI